jgi:type II secretory ATPase GspE/PulE/Tfp pilus assembly ATPase PilB-like protein
MAQHDRGAIAHDFRTAARATDLFGVRGRAARVCRRPKAPSESEATRALATLRSGDGCESCRQSGYRGRVGIFELLTVNDAIREQIQSRSNATAIRDQAVASGMRILRDDGLAKIAAGATTPEEVQRVTVRATM